MKKSILSLLILAGALWSNQAEAQLLKKIQNAATQGAQNAVNKKAESETNKAGNNALEGMFGNMLEPAPTESAYGFSGFMVMEIVNTDKKGKADKPVQMHYLLSDQPEFMGMAYIDPENPENLTTTIMDSKNQAMVILIDDGKSKSSMSMKVDYTGVQEEVDKEAEAQLQNPNYKIEKTGNKKDILGYSCEEYLVITEDGEGRYWITEKPIDGLSIFSPQSNPMISNKTMDRYTELFSNAPKGSFMEMIFKDNEGNVTDMKVVELDTNKARSYTMADYPNMMKQ
jgi:hypothetical protein